VTRAEHLAWCKERALEYLPDDPAQAMASFVSDLGKHPETAPSKGVIGELMMMHAMSGLLDATTCRNLIEGTN
jgi:hypothetical protein